MRDLPDLAEHAGLEFDFALAKGRRRYVCPRRLDERLHRPQDIPGPRRREGGGANHDAVHRKMLDAFSAKRLGRRLG